MYTIYARNVNEAYPKGLELLQSEGVPESSRAGSVLVMPAPVMTVYERPWERVLFDPQRDANPFFHLFEALWMLDGARDARVLDQFVKDFSSRFAEVDGRQHGAYGFRWRQHFEVEGGGSPFAWSKWGAKTSANQLEVIIRLLRENRNDRRIVLTMWDPIADLAADKKDTPCNTHVYFRVRRAYYKDDETEAVGKSVLDMTVCCRSNDAIWGAYGANAVHFSILQEYVAACVGVGIGRYYQFSNNFHVYCDVLEKRKPYRPSLEVASTQEELFEQWVPLVSNPTRFDADLAWFNRLLSGEEQDENKKYGYYNPWFLDVAEPMLRAHQQWKQGQKALAVRTASKIKSGDWRWAVLTWMCRRMHREDGGELSKDTTNLRQVAGTHYYADYQHWDLVTDTAMGYLEGQATRYVTRHRKKNGLEDLQKAAHFVDKMIARQRPRPAASSVELSAEAKQLLVIKFANENKLSRLEQEFIRQIVIWEDERDLLRLRGVLTALMQIEYPPPPETLIPVPADDSNKHAPRAGKEDNGEV